MKAVFKEPKTKESSPLTQKEETAKSSHINTKNSNRINYKNTEKTNVFLPKTKAEYIDNNMNYDEYVFSAKNPETGLIHQLEKITVMDGENPKSCIKNLGYEEPIVFRKLDFPAANDSQKMKYLRLANTTLPKNASYPDAEALIVRLENDITVSGKDLNSPHPQLVEYATEMGIQFSYFIGKKHLYELIFNSLDWEDQIFFYIFSVYKNLMQKRGVEINRNPNKCEHRDAFYEFVRLVADTDSDFENIIFSTPGHELRFFGRLEFDGKAFYGADTQNAAYEKTVNFLRENSFI
jgi:hypothetical protein